MKMRKSEHFTRSSSSIAGQSFAVKLTDKMFHTLFSSLYRYKEAAALRETFCNAVDSHKMRERLQRFMASHYASLTPPPQPYSKHLAPKGTRVVVHLPDDLEPWLEIRDYGIGLSLEQIVGEAIPAQENEVLIVGNMVVKEDEIPESAEVIGVPDFYEGRLVFRREDGEIIRTPGLYTTLFSSTKEEDNDQTGAFGLGSKSPFAVSDSFTVESRMDGKIHRFLMYLNADRIPTVDLVTKNLETRDPQPEDTDEYNGVTVKVPVQNSRFQSFAEELARLGRTLKKDELPIVENEPYNFEWKSISYGHRVNNTYIQNKSEGETHYAVMGGVTYPIDLAQLDEDTSAIMSKFPSSYTFFELGELNVPPSREDLSYDEYTRETLCKEFKVVANAIMTEKMAELELADSLGPLALFLEKSRLTQMFGSGFRKMLEKKYPADRRFNDNKYKYVLPIDIDRNYDHTAPFTMISEPFSLEIFDKSDGGGGSLYVSDLTRWNENKSNILVVVEDSIRARNLKIKQHQEKCDVLIVVKPASEYLHHRNSTKDNPAFNNSKELHDYFKHWVGTEDTTIDYLNFADKFEEFLSLVVKPTDVRFMSELSYTTPPVDKDPGMYKFDTHSFNFEKYQEATGDHISKIITEGKRIMFLEVSGYNSIHELRGKPIKERALRLLRDALQSTVVEVDENGKATELLDHLNIHHTIFLARRKSVPMMKKFPEVFIPVDQMFDILMEHNRPLLDQENAKTILAVYNEMRISNSRLKYGSHLLTQAQLDATQYEDLRSQHGEAYMSLRGLLDDKTLAEYKSAKNRKFTYNKKSEFSNFMKFVDEMELGKVTSSTKDKKVFKIESNAGMLYARATTILSNSYGFSEISSHKTPSRAVRQANRLMIERHRVVKFLKEHYVPSAHNAIEDQEEFISAISRRIANV